MTISKCEHGKYLDMCHICFPLPKPTESMNTFAKEAAQAFFPNGQVWIEKPELTLTDEEIEQVRVAIMGTAYWCADENMPEAYNAVKVCCSEVLAILRKAQEK